MFDHREYTRLEDVGTHLFEYLDHVAWLHCRLVGRQEEFKSLSNLVDFLGGELDGVNASLGSLLVDRLLGHLI